MSIAAVLIIGCTIAALMAFFEPGRALLKTLGAQCGKVLLKAAHLIVAFLQLIGMKVLIAHVQVIKNLMPRQSVLPSVRTKSVRRT